MAFRSLHEAEGITEITAPNGAVWSLFDIEFLYSRTMRRPMRITGNQLPVSTVPVGNYIQHGGKWRRITSIEADPKKSVLFIYLSIPEAVEPEDRSKRKKFSSSAKVLTLSPREKQMLDYDKANPCLPLRQQQAIELFLVQNMPEDTAAVVMGVSHTNPVGMYATSGLERLLKLIDQGYLDRFSIDDPRMLQVS